MVHYDDKEPVPLGCQRRSYPLTYLVPLVQEGVESYKSLPFSNTNELRDASVRSCMWRQSPYNPQKSPLTLW